MKMLTFLAFLTLFMNANTYDYILLYDTKYNFAREQFLRVDNLDLRDFEVFDENNNKLKCFVYNNFYYVQCNATDTKTKLYLRKTYAKQNLQELSVLSRQYENNEILISDIAYTTSTVSHALFIYKLNNYMLYILARVMTSTTDLMLFAYRQNENELRFYFYNATNTVLFTYTDNYKTQQLITILVIHYANNNTLYVRINENSYKATIRNNRQYDRIRITSFIRLYRAILSDTINNDIYKFYNYDDDIEIIKLEKVQTDILLIMTLFILSAVLSVIYKYNIAFTFINIIISLLVYNINTTLSLLLLLISISLLIQKIYIFITHLR